VIQAKNLTKTYVGTDVFSKIEFVVGERKKIGLVGRNGCGKSTLLKLINGIEDVSGGNLIIQNEKLGYIPQEFSFPDELVGVYLENFLTSKWEMHKIETLAGKLKFHNFDLYQPLNTLSEGQKMKVKLIEILLSDPTSLFIDEPTNHLDIEGIMWLEEYIRALPMSVVMISHDRVFLNNTVDEIWELENQKLFRFVGDYDNYKNEKNKLIQKWDQEYVLFLKKKSQLEKLLENVRKIKDGTKRGKAVQAAKKRIDREIVNNAKTKYESKKVKTMEFDTDVHAGKLMVRFDKVSKAFGENLLFEDMNFEIRGGDKTWLFGPNGAGKSTIIKMIMGQIPATSGEVKLGNNIKIGYYSQVQTELNIKNSIFDEFIEKTGCSIGLAYGYLKKFLFDKDSVTKKVKFLSPGERARFAFAIFAYKDYDLLILDEPDNHLDIETKEVLEQSLNDFKGTLLLVSHDRYFVEQIGVNKVLNLSNKVLVES
jgi:ATP-binding cassette subfamily F protein 3